MSAIPGPVTHPPGMFHPFDPVNCSSDAGWHAQQQQRLTMQHQAVAQQGMIESQIAYERAAEGARRDHLLLLRR